MEQFEKLLIQLGKKAKVILVDGMYGGLLSPLHAQENLMEGFKRSLARDFRINLEAMENEEEEVEGDEVVDGEREESSDGGEGPDDGPPPAKRHRAV